jgi:hypothetical protein
VDASTEREKIVPMAENYHRMGIIGEGSFGKVGTWRAIID